MLERFPLTVIVVVAALLVYVWVTLKVGPARRKYNVYAPQVDGPPEFQRVLRVQLNTLEQIVIFLPALVIFADAWGDLPTALVAAFWPLGRVIYAHRYYQSADKRGLGFGISFLSSAALLLGGLAGAVMQVAGAR